MMKLIKRIAELYTKNSQILKNKLEDDDESPLHFMHADFPWLLDLLRLAYLGGYRPAHALGLAAANLFRNLLAFLNSDIFAFLLGDRDALLLLVDAAHLLGDLLAGLVAALGQWHLNGAAYLGQGMADLLLDLVADFLGLVVADVLPDGSAHFGLLLMTLHFGLLGLHSGLGGDLLGLLAGNLVLDGSQDVSNLLLHGSLPLLGRFDLLLRWLRALLLGNELAFLLLDLLADGLCGLVALIFCHNLTVLGNVAHLLGLLNAVGPASLLILDMAVGHRDQDALVNADESALFLRCW